MRRSVILSLDIDDSLDEREIQFDIGALDDADGVLVFMERERRWERGIFRLSSAGDAVVDIRGYETITFEQALAMGIRRVLH